LIYGRNGSLRVTKPPEPEANDMGWCVFWATTSDKSVDLFKVSIPSICAHGALYGLP
jgi:outer membrane immunogenic protein